MTVLAVRAGNIKLIDDGDGKGHVESGVGSGPVMPVESILKWGYWKPVGETAAAWREEEHPRDEDGRFATKSILEHAADLPRDERPKVKLPANPKVEGLNTAINQWLKGRGGNSMNWVNEIRYEMADMLDVPYYGDAPYDHGMYTQRPPTEYEARSAAATILEGLRQARPEMPELWRGMFPDTMGEEQAAATMALINAKPGDTFKTLAVSASTDPAVAISYSSIGGDSKLPNIMLRIEPGSRAIKPPKDYFGDREVLTAGEYEVTNSERVRFVQDYGPPIGPVDRDLLVLSVRQTRGVEVFDG